MASGDNIVSTLDRIEAIAKGIAGFGASRVFQGHKRWADAQNLENLVAGLTQETQGYFFFWLREGGHGVDAGAIGSPPIFRVGGVVLIYQPKDVTSEYHGAIRLVESLKDAVLDKTSYLAGEGTPNECRYVFGGNAGIEMQGIQFWDFGGGDAGGEMSFFGGC